MQPVLQFDDTDGRQHDFGFAELLCERGQQLTDGPGGTLGGDEHAGVQD